MTAHAAGSASPAQQNLGVYWTIDSAELLRRLDSTDQGLSSAAAADRLRRFGKNELKEQQPFSRTRVLPSDVSDPLRALRQRARVRTEPASLLAVLAGIMALYVLATEGMKIWFYRSVVG